MYIMDPSCGASAVSHGLILNSAIRNNDYEAAFRSGNCLLRAFSRSERSDVNAVSDILSKTLVAGLAAGRFEDVYATMPESAGLHPLLSAMRLAEGLGEGKNDAELQAFLADLPALQAFHARRGGTLAVDTIFYFANAHLEDPASRLALVQMAYELDRKTGVLGQEDRGLLLMTLADQLLAKNKFAEMNDLISKAGNTGYQDILRARVYYKTGREDEAEALLIARLDGDAGPAALSYLYAGSFEAKRYETAARAMTIVLEEEDEPLYRLMRADAYAALKRPDLAEADIRRYLAAEPEDWVALDQLARMLLQMEGRLEDAEEVVQQAAALAQERFHEVDSISMLFYRKGDYAMAVRVLEARLEEEGTLTDERADWLADAYWMTGQRAMAELTWRRISNLSDDAGLKAAVEAKLRHGLDASGAPVRPQAGVSPQP